MKWPSDYHMHTPLCHHAVGEPADYAAQALALGFSEIGMSDHSPMPRDDWDDWRMAQSDLVDYAAKVSAARAAHPSLSILLGLEVDFIPGLEEWIKGLASRFDWDYFIGSVHYVSGDFDLDNPKKLSEWKKRDPFEVWSLYFQRLTQAASSGLFETIGHADLCKKFCFYPKEDCTALFNTFLEALADCDVALEINTAGLRKECREIYPSPSFLKLARKHRVHITFGSDAHAPSEVGANFSDAVGLAQETGFTHWCRFKGRQRELVPLS